MARQMKIESRQQAGSVSGNWIFQPSFSNSSRESSQSTQNTDTGMDAGTKNNGGKGKGGGKMNRTKGSSSSRDNPYPDNNQQGTVSNLFSAGQNQGSGAAQNLAQAQAQTQGGRWTKEEWQEYNSKWSAEEWEEYDVSRIMLLFFVKNQLVVDSNLWEEIRLAYASR